MKIKYLLLLLAFPGPAFAKSSFTPGMVFGFLGYLAVCFVIAYVYELYISKDSRDIFSTFCGIAMLIGPITLGIISLLIDLLF